MLGTHPQRDTSDYDIAFALQLDDDGTPSLLEDIWIHFGGQWLLGELPTVVRGRPHPGRLAALYAAAEIARNRQDNPERFIAHRDTDSSLWSFARRLVRDSRPRYIAELPCFLNAFGPEQILPSQPHPFFAEWFAPHERHIEIRPRYTRATPRQILFYRCDTECRPLDMTSKLGAPQIEDRLIAHTEGIEAVYRVFRRPSRRATGAAVKGSRSRVTSGARDRHKRIVKSLVRIYLERNHRERMKEFDVVFEDLYASILGQVVDMSSGHETEPGDGIPAVSDLGPDEIIPAACWVAVLLVDAMTSSHATRSATARLDHIAGLLIAQTRHAPLVRVLKAQAEEIAGAI